MGRYDGKKVLITGGTSGIGLASARMLLGEGARVIVTGRIPESLDAARTELGPGATVVSSDAAAPAEVDALVEEVRELSSGAST